MGTILCHYNTVQEPMSTGRVFFRQVSATSKQRFEQRFSQRLLVTSQDIPKVYCVFPCGCVFKMWYILHLGHLDIREIMIKPEILGILFSDRIHVS